MQQIIKHHQTLDQHMLSLNYAHLRCYSGKQFNNLQTSIAQHGQLVPIVVIESEGQRVVIDGYLRIKAMQKQGFDVVDAEVWSCSLAEGLLLLLTDYQSRRCEALEEGLILQELHVEHKLSYAQLSKETGRDKSWVSRRIMLVTQLPDNVLAAVICGQVPVWSAIRVLAPLARANSGHGELLLQYLENNFVSTRELRAFYKYYLESLIGIRDRLISNLGLYFKTKKYMDEEKSCRRLRTDPAGLWQDEFSAIIKILGKLSENTDHAIYAGQDSIERQTIIDLIEAGNDAFRLLSQEVARLCCH